MNEPKTLSELLLNIIRVSMPDAASVNGYQVFFNGDWCMIQVRAGFENGKEAFNVVQMKRQTYLEYRAETDPDELKL